MSPEILTWGAGMTGLAYSEVFPLDRGTTTSIRVADDEAVVHLADEAIIQIHHAGHHELHVGRGHESLIFVSTAPLPVIAIGRRHSTRFVDVVHGPLQLHAEGAIRIRVGDPSAFHEAFLRNTSHLDPGQFSGILESLVHSSLGHALQESFDTVEDIERDLGRLAAYLQRRLATLLAPIGLGVEEFEFMRLEIPTPIAVGEQPATTTPLVTSELDR